MPEPRDPATAWVHAALGNKDAAVRWLDLASQNREALLTFAAVDPAFGDLHAHPRFRELPSRLGLA